MKKVFALILAVALLASLALPAMAAEDHTKHSITIDEDNTGHNFAAYQIFAGDVVEMDTDGDETTVDVLTLSNVTWGGGIDATKTVDWDGDSLNLLAALQSEEVNPNYYNKYLQVPALNETATENNPIVDVDDQAAAIVKALSETNTTAHAFAFAGIVEKYLTNATASADEVTEDVGYVISPLADGYYLVRDEAADDAIPSEVKTLYIMQLVQDVVMAPKDGEVEVVKKIIEGGAEVDVCANNIGDVVEFHINGEMPDRLHEYTTFYYEFYDTMSKGLTLDTSSIALKTVNGDNVVTIGSEHMKADADDTDYLYEIVTSTDSNGNTILRVIIPDVRKIDGHTSYSVVGTTKLRLTYNATVNAKAEIGNPGNPNKVKVVFSNDPYGDGHGETPEDTVLVFTFELDVTKVDGSTQKKLQGVEFVLYRMREGSAEYAVIDENNKLTGWTKYLDQAAIDADTTLTAEQKAAAKFATPLATDANGFFKVVGLDINATFYLKETKALDGYEEIADIEIVVTGSYNDVTKAIENLMISVDRGTAADGDEESGIVAMTVVNNPGKTLPSTGGVGTTMFYVFGSVLVLAAIVLLVTKKRMASEA